MTNLAIYFMFLPFLFTKNLLIPGGDMPDEELPDPGRKAGRLCRHGWFWYMDAKRDQELPVTDCVRCLTDSAKPSTKPK